MNDTLDAESLIDLFRLEVENQRAALSDGLISLERGAKSPQLLESLMRSAHSIKGAARIVDRSAAVDVAHAMEDCFVAAQKGALALTSRKVDTLLQGVDLLGQIAAIPQADLELWTEKNRSRTQEFCGTVSSWTCETAESETTHEALSASLESESAAAGAATAEARVETATAGSTRSLRVTADNLNRLLALAGESKVASKWMDEFAIELIRLKQQARKLSQFISGGQSGTGGVRAAIARNAVELEQRILELNTGLARQLGELDLFNRRFLNLSSRLYDEVLDTRMRPFGDGTREFPRMVRDLARSLGKDVSLDIVGESTAADREVLEKLQAPLTHLLRNAVDHGIELPEERRLKGKPAAGTVRLEARHSSGMLLITVQDDGAGIDAASVRNSIVEKKLSTAELAENMSEAELFEFLFLPGFSMRTQVTEISGRGVGLDLVQTMLKEVGGRVRITSRPNQGTTFHLELPLTLSVIRTLLVEIAGEGYAFPLARLHSVRRVAREQIQNVHGREYFEFDGEQIGLVHARQIFALDAEAAAAAATYCIVVLGDRTHRYGLIVDGFRGERELVVLPLDERLGKVRNISAAALMPDRAPVLIVDIDDVLRSIEKLSATGHLAKGRESAAAAGSKSRKRILVVDDSLTIRELERKLLEHRGYEVDIAIDGMDGWNAVQTAHYDLVVTDVDMPRMDGIELVHMIKKEARLSGMPVMIVSYKDREEDRQRGLQAGASYYLTKASFHDETLLQAVADLIGVAGE
jgi:two-component system, chemotaxis family, sensor histidine kinase and response regulator WspE